MVAPAARKKRKIHFIETLLSKNHIIIKGIITSTVGLVKDARPREIPPKIQNLTAFFSEIERYRHKNKAVRKKE